jgi:BirA family transcriptional regulator, biotin operon repressor / biotin---[acetyl-CoA-carboxylase] ligase
MKTTLTWFDELDSTNTEALRRAREGAPEGICILARSQTAGRGRHGRAWSSPADAGLYLSIVLRPALSAEHLPLITLMAGVAVHEMLLGLGLRPDIKWVNDILIDGKKVAGILAETAETQSGLAVVLGIGINLNFRNFPPEIADTAASIEDFKGVGLSPVDAADALLPHIGRFYELLRENPAAVLDEWRSRSTWHLGKPVRVNISDETVEGVTDGIEPNGALRLRTPSGLKILQSGDVHSLRS